MPNRALPRRQNMRDASHTEDVLLWDCREFWSEREDSNLRPPAPEAGALPDCATLRPCGGVTPSRRTLQEGAAHQFGAAVVLLRPRMNKPAAMIMPMPTIIVGVIASLNKSQPRMAAQMICEYCIGATMIAGALR